MAIEKSPTTPTLETARYFSTKDINVPTIFSRLIDTEIDFCTCLQQCVPPLPAFTDEIGTDFYKNDRFRMFMNVIPAGTTVLKIVQDNGTEYNVAGATYGNQYTATNVFTYEFLFFKIWNVIGYGIYKFVLTNLNGASEVVQSDESPWFNLSKYSDKAAHGTVRIETKQKGKLFSGLKYINPIIIDYYSQQIRFRGYLVYSGHSINNSGLQLNSSERSRIQIKDQILPAYRLTLKLASAPQIAQTLFDYLLANDVAISDYSIFNHTIDPRNYSAQKLRSIPLTAISADFDPNHKNIKKTYTFDMEYSEKNIFKINN